MTARGHPIQDYFNESQFEAAVVAFHSFMFHFKEAGFPSQMKLSSRMEKNNTRQTYFKIWKLISPTRKHDVL